MATRPPIHPGVRVMDSHTEGEPTRVVIEGGPDLGGGTMKERASRFEQYHDDFRRWLMLEPRGYDYLVGALICPPTQKHQAAGVLFFNNVGLLGMCGHGTIGVAVTLSQLGRIGPGWQSLDTPVGEVRIECLNDHQVAITNVPSWRYRKGVVLEIPGYGQVIGDIAWGGNWFFLTEQSPCPIELPFLASLTSFAQDIREQLEKHAITGDSGELIDHIEITGPSARHTHGARNFVLCPGGAYDRSPCGTGTSAKLACLAAEGKLEPGQSWFQESVIGSCFEASYQRLDGQRILPRIMGSAYVYSEATFTTHHADPFQGGIYGLNHA